jgi:hypothetical protein
MLAEFDNRYRLMCRQTLTNTLIFNAYNKVTERIKQICYNVAHFGSSADAWTSDTGEPFLAITIHHVNEEFVIQSTLLAFRKFSEKHTAINILQRVEQIMSEYGILNKVVSETTDAGANMKKAIMMSSKLIQDVATRFNYVKIMLGVLLNGHEAVKSVINGDKTYKEQHGNSLLTPVEIGKLKLCFYYSSQ